MRWRWVGALAIGATLGIGQPAPAQSRAMQIVWTIQPAPVPPDELVLAGGEFVLKQRLLPSGLAELGADVRLGSNTVAAGAQLVEVMTEGARVYCIPAVAAPKLLGASFQPCLVDDDADGDFEGWFNVVSQTRGLLSVGGNRPRRFRPIAETRYATADPATMRDTYFVAVERRNYFNIYSLESFTIAFGSDRSLDRLTAPVSVRTSELPETVTILGARFIALGETEGRMRVRVERTMPPQPFGVVTTTTYRFY